MSQHRALAKAYIPNPENKPCVNHIDSVRDNNELSNLEWCTVAENNLHGRLYGSIRVGRVGLENHNTCLSEEEVHRVCSLLQDGIPTCVVNRTTGVALHNVFDIKAKVTWIEISSLYDLPEISRDRSEEQVHLICSDIEAGLTDKDINARYTLKRGNLRHIKNRHTFKHISILYNW